MAPDVKAGAKLNQIFPTGPTLKQLKVESKRTVGQDMLSFDEAFGMLGSPMLFVLVVCVTWTMWLIFMALAPNKAANFVMSTGSYDNGQFWLIDDANPQMTLAGAVGLILVAMCYLLVILRMLFWREKMLSSRSRRQNATWFASTEATFSWSETFGSKYRRIRVLWDDVTSFGGRNRKRWVSHCFCIVDAKNIGFDANTHVTYRMLCLS